MHSLSSIAYSLSVLLQPLDWSLSPPFSFLSVYPLFTICQLFSLSLSFFHTQVLFCSIIPNFLHYSPSFFQLFTVPPPLRRSIAPLLLFQPIYQSDTLTSLISTFYLSHTQSGHGFAHCTAPFVSLMLKGHQKTAKKSVCVWELSSDKYSRHAALF